jgi:hypothetical protein
VSTLGRRLVGVSATISFVVAVVVVRAFVEIESIRLDPVLFELRDTIDVLMICGSGYRLHETSRRELRGLAVMLSHVDFVVVVGVLRWIRRSTRRVVGV